MPDLHFTRSLAGEITDLRMDFDDCTFVTGLSMALPSHYITRLDGKPFLNVSFYFLKYFLLKLSNT